MYASSEPAHSIRPRLRPSDRFARRSVRSTLTAIDDRTGREGVPCARVDLIAKRHQSLTRLDRPLRLVLALATHLVHARRQREADHAPRGRGTPARRRPHADTSPRATSDGDAATRARHPRRAHDRSPPPRRGRADPNRPGRAPSGNPATGTSSRSPWRTSPRGTPAESRFILISHSFQRFALPAASPLTTVPLKAGWRRVEPALLTHHKNT